MKNSDLIFDALPFPCLLIEVRSQGFRIKDINRYFCEIFHQNKKELTGKDISKIFLQQSRETEKKFEASLAKALASGETGKIHNFNYPLYNDEKGKIEERTWDIEMVPVKDRDGELLYVMSIFREITAKRPENSKLQQLESLLQDKIEKEKHFVENNNDAFYCLDLEGNFTSLNQGIARLTERSREELLGTSFIPFCAPHHLEKILGFFKKATQGEKQKFEAQFISAGNRRMLLEVSLSPLITMGKITGVYGIARDLTLLRNYQHSLERNEKKFKALIQEGSDLMAILDVEGTYKFVSDTSFHILGIESGEFIGKSAFDFMHPGDREWVMEKFHELESLKQIEIKPFRFKNAANEWRWIETKATNLCQEPGVEGIVVNSRDVTERINSQKAVVESEERYRSFFFNSFDAILVTVPDGSILAANPSACRMFQRSEEDICRIGRAGLVDPLDARLSEALRVRKETGRANIELCFVRKDGTKFAGEVTSSIFTNSEGKVLSSVIIRDISEKKKAENELKRSWENYKFLFEFNPLPTLIFDNESLDIVAVNEAAIAHYGFSREEFLSMKLSDLRPEEEIPNMKRILQSNRPEQKILRYDNIVHRKKDLSVIKVEVTGLRFNLNEKDCTLVVCHDITERETILQKLKDREIKLKTAQKIARLGYWEMNLKDNSLYWTKEVYNIWGRDPKEFTPSPEIFIDTVHPEDLRDFSKHLDAALAGNIDLDAEHRILLPGGAVKWVQEKGKLVKDEHGQPLCFEGTVQDITDRKKSIQELMLSEARQSNILNSQTNYLTRTDLFGNYTYCNSKFQEEFGWLFADAQIIGNHASFTVKDYHLEKIRETFNQCLENPNTVFHVEIDKKTRKGRVRHTLWDFICLTNANGEPLEFQCAGIDITDRVEAEQIIKETNRRYDLVTQATSDAIWDWQCDTDTLFWGEGFKSLFGHDSQVFPPGANIWKQNLHPEDAPKVLKNLKKVLDGTGTKWQEEYRFKRKNGSYSNVIDKGFIIRGEEDQPLRMVGAMQDITDRKAATQKLKLSEARFKSLIQSQTNYVIRVDMAGNYSYCNQKFQEDFEWLYDDHILLGRNTIGSIMEYHRNKVLEISEQCMIYPNSVFQVEIDKPSKDGGVLTTLWDFIGITDPLGNPTEIQCVGIDISARVKAEKELQESNARYELVTRATTDAIWDWDLTTGRMYLGEGFQYLFGYNSTQAFTTIDDWAGNVHSEDFFRVTNTIYAAIEGNLNKFSSTYRYKQANGEYAYVSDRALIVRDENNKAVRIVGAMQDITEKKKLEDLLDKATSLARIGSYEVDIPSRKLYWSPMTKQIHEVGNNYSSNFEEAFMFYEEGSCREKMKAAYNNAVARNISFEVESKLITANGNERWVRVMGDPEFEDGKCIRLSGSIQDIDKIKMAEIDILRAAEEKQAILESIGDAFFALNHNWKVTYWNKKAEEILDCPKERILGKQLGDVLDIAGTPFERLYEKGMQENSVQHFETFFEGTRSWFEVNVYPSSNGLSVYLRDVTERKKSNLKLLDLNENLKKYTEELVTANKGLEQFSYIISHNLRAPVANIIGLTELLDEEIYSEEIKSNLRSELRGSVERLDEVIKDLNQILQIKNNVSEIKKSVNLDELVTSIKINLQDLIDREQVNLITDFTEVREINTVSSYLYSIFYNLIFNSIKFRQPGIRPLINIRSQRDGDKVVLSFCDNGLGIDLENKGDQLYKLYKRFHHHVEGKGMGLFMVKTQVEMLGGEIHASSEVNNGTSFKITFRDGNFNQVENEKTAQLYSY